MVHNISLSTEGQKVESEGLKVESDGQKVESNGQKVEPNGQKVEPGTELVVQYKCDTCYKSFSCNKTLKRHIPNCSHKTHPLQCCECLNIFSSKSSLYHHKKHCKGLPVIPVEESEKQVPTTSIHNNNIQQQNIQNANTINNNTFNIILPCPRTREEAFDFDVENITHAFMKQIAQYTNDSSLRFNRFIGKVFENPKNRVIRKTNPKDSHSMIHVGDGKWEYAYDKDTLPIITHHMTTAALGKIIDIEKKASYLIESLKSFRQQIREINEMDYDDETYKDTLQRIKLAIVNFTQELQKEEKLLKDMA